MKASVTNSQRRRARNDFAAAAVQYTQNIDQLINQDTDKSLAIHTTQTSYTSKSRSRKTE